MKSPGLAKVLRIAIIPLSGFVGFWVEALLVPDPLPPFSTSPFTWFAYSLLGVLFSACFWVSWSRGLQLWGPYPNTSGAEVSLDAVQALWTCPDCREVSRAIVIFTPFRPGEFPEFPGYPRFSKGVVYQIGLWSAPVGLRCSNCKHEFRTRTVWDDVDREEGGEVGYFDFGDYEDDGVAETWE